MSIDSKLLRDKLQNTMFAYKILTMHSVVLDHLRHNGIQNIRIDFRFDRQLNEIAKSIPARWSSTHKCFYLENTPDNLQKILNAFKGRVWVDMTRLEARKELFPKTVLQKGKEAQKNISKTEAETKQRIERFGSYLLSMRYSPHTVKNYKEILNSFFGFVGKKIEETTHEDVERFNEEFILKNQYSVSYQRQVVSALKLLYGKLPGHLHKIKIEKLERPHRSMRLPVVLSEEEMIALLKNIGNLKHRAIVMLLYSSGLRISELLNLLIADIDINRMQIRIVKGKGDKDRYVGLSEVFLIILKQYAQAYQPKDYLFNGEHGGKYSAESVRHIIRNACRKAKIRKKVTPHVLRHSYATHLLENGTDLRFIQELLGHKKPETTMVYTHVAKKKLTSVKSPLDIIARNEIIKINSTNKEQEQLRLSRTDERKSSG